ncbi:MAG: hypothetical protein Q9166_000683 [cf. Caloplaca sp. 2 TL-2023]
MVLTSISTDNASLVVFTAWTVNSQYSSAENRCEVSAWTTSLTSPYFTITVPTSLGESDVPLVAATSFAASKGLTECYAQYVPTALVAVSDLSSVPSVETTIARSGSPNTTSTDTAPSASSTKPKPRIPFAILMPFVAVIALVAIAATYIVLKRYRKRKRENGTNGDSVPVPDDTPYFQQKGELEAVQCRFELESNQRPLEVSEDNEIREMTTPANTRLHVLDRPELRGHEYCKELGGEEHSRELE